MVETRKRKSKSLATSSSRSDDDDAQDMRSKTSKRKKEDVEGSNATETKSSADSGPYVCRFCGADFRLSQALGGHMNRHRLEKDDEEIQKAEALVARRNQYVVPNQWIVQGGGGGGNPYNDGTLQPNPSGPTLGTPLRPFYSTNPSATTLQGNQVLAAHQNAQVSIHSLQGGGYHNPYGNTMHPQGNIISAEQFQGHHSAETVYSDSQGNVSQSGADTEQSHGHFHSNQGGLSDAFNFDISNTPSNQAQPNIAMVSDSSVHQSRVQIVDQQGNPAQHEFRPGHDSHALPQDAWEYT